MLSKNIIRIVQLCFSPRFNSILKSFLYSIGARIAPLIQRKKSHLQASGFFSVTVYDAQHGLLAGSFRAQPLPHKFQHQVCTANANNFFSHAAASVSYTHLDVYKRQGGFAKTKIAFWWRACLVCVDAAASHAYTRGEEQALCFPELV